MQSKRQFPAPSEQQIEAQRMPPEGIFPADVETAMFQHAQSNGELMIALRLKVLINNSKRTMFCNIMLNEDWAWLHRHFWKSAGKLEIYDAQCAEESDYLAAKVTVKVTHGFDKRSGEKKARISDFITVDPTSEDSLMKTTTEGVPDFPDEEIPF